TMATRGPESVGGRHEPRGAAMESGNSRGADPLTTPLGERTRPAIIVPISGDTSEAVLDAADAIGHAADIVEWRADGLDELTPDWISATASALESVLAEPLLFTVRTRTEGGTADVDDDTYAELVLAGIRSDTVAYVDIEFRREPHVVAALIDAARNADVATVLSAHDFAATAPSAELRELYDAMCSVGADVVKVAVMPHSARDVLRMLEVALDVRDTHPDQALVNIAMGRLGVVTRIAAATFGSVATFAAVGTTTAPGQLDADALRRMLAITDRA